MDSQQWSMSMNPAFYQNMANANVDWAALAQQWIQMKETLPPEQMALLPDAPPPPRITTEDFHPNRHLEDEEKGEAPMEVERDEDDAGSSNFSHNQFPVGQQSFSAWNNQLGYTNSPGHYNVANQVGWKNPAWQVWEMQANTGPNVSRPPPLCPELEGYSTKKRWNKMPPNNMQPPPAPMINEEEEHDSSDIQTLDAAKRKILPAWIREGLEKMEREKQKEEEKRKMDEERIKYLDEKRKAEADALQELQKSQVVRSKFDSDDSENEANDSRNESPVPKMERPKTRTPSPEKLRPHKNREELIQDLMMSVRRNLTEILLEVTNEEIKSIAKETYAKMKTKVNRAVPLRKTALTSITGGLGLGIYDSGSGSSSEEEGSNKDNDETADSENEIKEIMKRKRANFERVAEEIEDYLEKEELAEQMRQKEWNRRFGNERLEKPPPIQTRRSSSSSTSNDEVSNNNHSGIRDQRKYEGEPHHSNDRNYNKSGSGQPRGKRISRFSDPRDKVDSKELAQHTAMFKAKNENNSKSAKVDDPSTSNNSGASSASAQNSKTQLDLNQFLRREVTKDMMELLKQVKRARSSSSSSSSSGHNRKRKKSKKSKKKHSRHKSKRSRSSSSSSSSSSNSSDNHRKSKRSDHRHESSRKKKDRGRSRSKSRESYTSSRSSRRSRSRSRDKRYRR